MILLLCGIVAAAAGSLFFSTITYALRDLARARLADRLEALHKERWLEPTLDHRDELILATAVLRLVFNLLLFLGVVILTQALGWAHWPHYLLSLLISLAIALPCSVALPHALAANMGETILALLIRTLHALRVVMRPITWLMHGLDGLVRSVAGKRPEPEPEEIEQEILSVVEEGAEEGVVDPQEREMIESVIEFHDTTAGQIMTARPEIVALEVTSSLDEIKRTLEESGHSRIPVYQGSLDQMVGMLYARDLLKHIGRPSEEFDIRSAMRPVIFVPETKPLKDLLREFRQQKVHIAVVLDEYSGTAGLLTIEDILEELVGEIADEHEPPEPAMFKRLAENTYEADALIEIDELNRRCGLSIPENEGYNTLGGFVSMTLGRIPANGTAFEHSGARYTILDAEPARVKRLKIELLPQPASP